MNIGGTLKWSYRWIVILILTFLLDLITEKIFWLRFFWVNSLIKGKVFLLFWALNWDWNWNFFTSMWINIFLRTSVRAIAHILWINLFHGTNFIFIFVFFNGFHWQYSIVKTTSCRNSIVLFEFFELLNFLIWILWLDLRWTNLIIVIFLLKILLLLFLINRKLIQFESNWCIFRILYKRWFLFLYRLCLRFQLYEHSFFLRVDIVTLLLLNFDGRCRFHYNRFTPFWT